MSRPSQYTSNPVYFYLIPILIILIVFAYTFISYQRNIATAYNSTVKVYNKKVVDNNRKGKKVMRDIQQQETAARRGIPISEPEQVIVQKPAPSQQVKTAHQAKEGETNWCRLPQAKSKQSSLHQQLRDFGPEKAIDGNSDGSFASTSVSATKGIAGEKSWWMVDLGKEMDRPIREIVIHGPIADHPLGVFSNFRIILVNKDKKIVAEKSFHTDNSPASTCETWVLDSPVEARGIRIESMEPGRPIIISELEAYGK